MSDQAHPELDPLEYAIMVIEGYQMELRNSDSYLDERMLARLAQGETLADVGFCQGRIYGDAIARIRRLASEVEAQ